MKSVILEVHIRTERNLRIVKYSTPLPKRQLIFLNDRGIVGERNPPCPVDLFAALVLVLERNICTIVFACGELFNSLLLGALGPQQAALKIPMALRWSLPPRVLG